MEGPASTFPPTLASQPKRNVQHPRSIRSNLTLQILFFSNAWTVAAVFVIEILIFIYKGANLPYPPDTLLAEVFLLIFFPVIEAVRLYFGMKANLTRRVPGIVVALLFAVPAFLLALYLMLWQTYILRLEFILAIIQLLFISLEIVFSLVAAITFSRSPDVFA